MAEVYVFDAKLESHVERPVTRPLALASRQTLVDLDGLIQEAFEWDDDHLYSFWLEGKFWGDKQTEYTAPFGLEESDAASADVELRRLGLRKGQRIAYVFDFGDEWRVSVKLREAREGGETGILERKGDPPPQYPDYDE